MNFLAIIMVFSESTCCGCVGVLQYKIVYLPCLLTMARCVNKFYEVNVNYEYIRDSPELEMFLLRLLKRLSFTG